MQASVGAFGRISAWLKLAENKKTDASNTKDAELAQGMCDQDQGSTQKGAHKENEMATLRLQRVMVTDEDSGRKILDQITLNLVPGELVAVVGASGAGKSTLCQVCAGLIEPTNGSVLLGDKHVAEYVEMDDQSRLTYMPQTPTFFTGSIEDNIRLGSDVTLDRVKLAAEQAGLHQYIEAQEGQYAAMLHEKGANLSGGQQQRLSLARLFMRSSDLYILDEPTSSLDIQTEQNVMNHLLNFMKGRIGLLVTHRMEVARQCSRILVMEHGRIAEDGTHEQLMQRKGLYYRMNARGGDTT
jgi:ABC-type bacteriocin/lantibiotic exporter with double-glycine peptidase domain